MSKKTTPDSDSNTEQKKRKWPRRLAWILGISLCVGLAVNGPIARRVVHHFINVALEDQGMLGSLKVDGSLASGFSLTSVEYRGELGIQSLDIHRASVDYNLLDLFDYKIKNLTIINGTAVIDIAKFPPTDDTAEDSKTDALTIIRSAAVSADISIKNLDITLLKQEQPLAQFQVGNFTHDSGDETFHLSEFIASDGNEQSTPSQTLELVWQPHAVSLDHIEILPDIALADVNLEWSSDLSGTAKLHLHQAVLAVEASDSISAKLIEGVLDSRKFDQQFDLALPFQTTISSLRAEVSNWQKPIPEWDVSSSITVRDAAFQKQKLSNITLDLSQKNFAYQIRINDKISSAQVDGKWLAPNEKEWWLHTNASAAVVIENPAHYANPWVDVPAQLDLAKTKVRLEAHAQVRGENITAKTDTQITGLTANGAAIPDLSVKANYATGKDIAATISTDTIKGEFQFNEGNEQYSGNLAINEPKPDWINALASAFGQNITFSNALKINWQGSGNLTDQHNGKLSISNLNLNTPDIQNIVASAEMNYDWPNKLDISSLSVQEGDWHATASLKWDGKLVTLPAVKITNLTETVASVSGSVPYQASVTTPQQFFEQKQPWSLRIKSQPIAIKKLSSWLPLEQLKELAGNTSVNLNLAGSPRNPSVQGNAMVNISEGLGKGAHDPVSLSLDLASKDQHLNISGNLTENKTQRVTLKAKLPFTPSAWLKSNDLTDTLLNKTTIEGNATIHTLPLARFARFIPQLEKITGSLDGQASISGTLGKPSYKLDLKALVPSIKLNDFDYGEIRNVKFQASIDEKQIATTTTTAEVNGGKFQINGSADINDLTNPKFEFHLSTRYALVHRDDLLSVRANTNIKVAGTIKQATVSGTIGVAESLVYKDINLIPIGVPSTEVAKVKLPSIDAQKADAGLPVPKPFADWKLDLTLKTDDPILLRGNLARGNVQGKVSIRGTAAKPELNGSFYAHDISAKLPFSVLKIPKGEIKFTPKTGLNPQLNIRGKSQVGGHDVSVYVYGSAASPKTTFTAFPPLPEHEVLTLLATGTTTAGLENRDVATFKAFQLFLHQMKQRADQPGGNKLFRAVLEGTQDLNLKVGEVDPFTGKKFASATVELRPRWHLTAQVDNLQQTRGLVVYVIRFR